MKVLVTGGTGFIGGHLVVRLVKDGDEVRVLDLPGKDTSFLDGMPVTLVQGSACEPDSVAKAVEGVDTVFHLASIITEGKAPEEHYREVNVGSTMRVLDACEQMGVRRFVLTSSINVHPPIWKEPLDESSPTGPDEILGHSKLEAEALVRDRCARSNIPFTILRPTRVYGPRDRSLLKLFRMIARGRFLMIGDGKRLMQPVYVSDLVEALVRASRTMAAENETFLVAGPAPLTKWEFCEAVAASVGRKLRHLWFPESVATPVAKYAEELFRLIEREPPISRRRIRFFLTSQVCNTDKARRVLGFTPAVSAAEGTRVTSDWYRQAGWL